MIDSSPSTLNQHHHHHRRRRRPGDQTCSLPDGASPLTRRTTTHANRAKALYSPRKPRVSTTQVVLGFAILNGSLVFMFIWLWYTGVMNLPSGGLDLLSSSQSHHRVEKKRRHHKRLEAPIIVVGLPKAGTSSLFEYFHCLGIYSQHWYCCGKQDRADQPGSGGPIYGPSYMSHCLLENLASGNTLLDGCGDYDAYTELNGPHLPLDEKKPADGIFLPQHYHLQELYEAEPKATWILNLRPIDDWVRSVMNVPANRLLEQFQEEVAKNHVGESSSNVTAAGEKQPNFVRGGRREGDVQFLKEFWTTHIDRVVSFANSHPEITLIQVNISNPDTGLDLADDLGWSATIPPIQQHTNISRLTRPVPTKARACWKKYNVGDYN
eukprot:scaffold9004_cov107-Cylindrotheca_fusiformis.AAC.4